jgi:hypothetical protein
MYMALRTSRQDDLPMTVTRKPNHQGDNEGNRNTVAQGMSESSGEPVATTFVWLFLFHPKLRASLAPGIPCPLVFRGTMFL